MRQQFASENRIAISAGRPSDISSTIEVSGLRGSLRDIRVTIDVDHSWTSDLEISLVAPDGETVLLVGREGGSGDHFRNTTFDDQASVSVTGAAAPFSGAFRPEQSLSAFANRDPNGLWTLRIVDRAFFDGGALNRWSLDVATQEMTAPSEFSIEVRFLGGLSAAQQDVFELAAARWSEIIVGDLPSVRIGRDIIDDVLIEAQGIRIDGPNMVLGRAGPRFIRTDSRLPVTGIMEFDTADLARLEAEGSLVNVIIHEMGHVLGIGTLWSELNLLSGAGTFNPVFTGRNAMREFAALIGESVPTPVPVANTGGAGTRDGHWREAVFGDELMTGFLNAGMNPLSRVSIAALQDMGYQVNFDAADPYALPSALRLALMGVGADHELGQHCGMCGSRIRGTVPIAVPESAMMRS